VCEQVCRLHLRRVPVIAEAYAGHSASDFGNLLLQTFKQPVRAHGFFLLVVKDQANCVPAWNRDVSEEVVNDHEKRKVMRVSREIAVQFLDSAISGHIHCYSYRYAVQLLHD
jgi:hypothetical protein